MIKGIIFDADGTLLDSMFIWEDLGARYLTEKGLKAEPGLGDILSPMTLEDSSRYLKNNYSIPDSTDTIKADILQLLENFYRFEVGLKPGVKHFLERLNSKGIKLAIATSGEKKLLVAALKRLEILEYFSRIATCSEYNTSKTEPFIFLKTAKALNTEPSETAVFEDALYAVKTAKAAGFYTVALEDKSNASDKAMLIKCADCYISDFNDKLLDTF